MEKFIIHSYTIGIMYVDFCCFTLLKINVMSGNKTCGPWSAHVCKLINLLKQNFKPLKIYKVIDSGIAILFFFSYAKLAVLQLQAVQNEWSLM